MSKAERATPAEGGPPHLKTTINGLSNSSTEIGDQARKLANKVACVLVKGAWRNVLPIHPAAERIPEATDGEKRSLAGDLGQRGQQMQVLLVRVAGGGPQLLDGRTRLDLLEGLGTEVVDAAGNVLVPHDIIDVASDAEAEARSLSLNLHRRHLTPEQKRELIAQALKEKPEASDRAIGKQIGADHKTVAAVRRVEEGRGEIPHVKARTDTKGRKQPAKKKSPRKPSASKPEREAKNKKKVERRELEAAQAYIEELETAREHDKDLAEKLRMAEFKIIGLESEIGDSKRENAELRQELESAKAKETAS